MNRDARTRLNPDELARVLTSEAARFVLLSAGRMLGLAERPTVALFTRDETQSLLKEAIEPLNPLFLGRTIEDGTPVFAVASPAEVDIAAAERSLGSAVRWLVLREDIALLSDRDAGVFTTALALINWHTHAEFSPQTGALTAPAQGGWMRMDPESGTEIYPRTDPAIIVLITDDDDRVLLGSNVLWEEDRFSLLAGFVEAGESLEAAVHREMEEEAGVRVCDLRYVASQPWPFPRSLMIGFTARLAPGQLPDQLRRDESEIAALRWFTRAELLSEPRTVKLPGGASIARYILDAWLHGRDGFV
jgi:NAD+ diphosphatase